MKNCFPQVIYLWYTEVRNTLVQYQHLDRSFSLHISSSNHFRVFLVWLHIFYPNRIKDAIRYIIILDKSIRTRGIKTTIKDFKVLRNLVTRYLCGSPIYKSDRVRIMREGWPFRLKFLWHPDITTSPQDKRFVLSLLVFLRGIQGKDAPDLSPITRPYTGVNLDIIKGIIESSYRILSSPRQFPEFKSWHLTTKSGPYGHSLSHLVDDFKSLSSDIKIWLSCVGGDRYSSYINKIETFITVEREEEIRTTFKQSKSKWTQIFSGRLNMVPDSESKTRVIAQINYFIQAALRPLHEDLIRILSKIPNDLTFDQSLAPNKLVRSPGSIYHSLDLSQATDRFPMELQQHLLLLLYGNQLSDAWGNIIRIPFLVDPKIGGEVGQFVRYSIGQPIGCYSSWSAFTLTHHCIAQYSIKASGCTNKACYVILGDDIVIADDAVACIYKEVLGKLGVEISELKSHSSTHSYEIAKRWFSEDGREYSPWSTHALAACGRSPGIIQQCLKEQSLKGWSTERVSSPVITTILLSLYNTGSGITPVRYFRNIWRLSLWNYIMDEVLNGKVRISTFVRFVSLMKGYEIENTPTDVVVDEIQISLVTRIKESVQTLGKELGAFISSDVKFLDTEPFYSPNDPNSPSSLIFWPTIEFIHLMREDVISKFADAFNRKLVKTIEWKNMMRIIITPNLSKIMVARDTEVRGIVTSIFVRESISTLTRVNENRGESLPSRTFGKTRFLARRTGEKYKFIN